LTLTVQPVASRMKMPKIESVEDNRIYRDDAVIRRLVEKYHSPLYVFDETPKRKLSRERPGAMG
jgi:hypothetical protein